MPHFESYFLNSLKKQTFKNFEVVIVDGGSEDGSLEAIERYRKHLKIRSIIDKTKNIGYIRTVGCKASKGEIIFNTSSDVYFPPNLLEELDAFYTKNDCLRSVAIVGAA